MAADIVRFRNPADTSKYFDINNSTISGCFLGVEKIDFGKFTGYKKSIYEYVGKNVATYYKTGLNPRDGKISFYLMSQQADGYRASLHNALNDLYNYMFIENVQLYLDPPGRYVVVNCLGVETEDNTDNDSILNCQANFIAADPFSYEASATTQSYYYADVSGIQKTFHISGMVEVEPVIRYTNYGGGSLSGFYNDNNFSIINYTNGTYFEYNDARPLISGWYVEVDCGAGTVIRKDDSGASASVNSIGYMNSPTFLKLEPNRTNNIAVIDSSQPSGQLKLTYTNRWYV